MFTYFQHFTGYNIPVVAELHILIHLDEGFIPRFFTSREPVRSPKPREEPPRGHDDRFVSEIAGEGDDMVLPTAGQTERLVISFGKQLRSRPAKVQGADHQVHFNAPVFKPCRHLLNEVE